MTTSLTPIARTQLDKAAVDNGFDLAVAKLFADKRLAVPWALQPDIFGLMPHQELRVRIDAADIEVGIHPEVLRPLLHARWDLARREASRLSLRPPYQRDGIAVVAGPSWSQRYGYRN